MIQRTASRGGFEDEAGYCRAVRAGSAITVSGTVAGPPAGSALAAMDTYEQTRNALAVGIEAVESLGGDRNTIVHTRLYLSPGGSWRDASRAHRGVFADSRPANTTVYVSALIPPGALIEIELQAVTVEAKA